MVQTVTWPSGPAKKFAISLINMSVNVILHQEVCQVSYETSLKHIATSRKSD